MSGFVQYQHERHYIAYIRQPESWLKCDDAIVTKISGELGSMWPSLIFLQRYRRHKKRRLEHPVEVTHRDLLRRLPQCLHALVAPGQPKVAAAGGGWRPGRFAVRVCRRRRSDHRRRKRKRHARTRSGRAETRSGRAQIRAGRTQTRSGRAQIRSGRAETRTRSGGAEKRDRSGRPDARCHRECAQRQATAFGQKDSCNTSGLREDSWADEDITFLRFQANQQLHRRCEKEELRMWPQEAVAMARQPCLLCSEDFDDRAAWLEHVNSDHGGLQRYRNAMLALQSLSPHVVVGSEVRHYVSNYATFLRSSSMDWELPLQRLKHVGLEDSHDFPRRVRRGCVFCARSFWLEELLDVFLAGAFCFMSNAAAVWELLAVERYKKRWPKIPAAELEASSVDVGTDGHRCLVLLHKRRVSAAAVRGEESVGICHDGHRAFSSKKPRLCRFALANDLWLGRMDPLFVDANMTHEMCLALARTVATKVVLRACGTSVAPNQWDCQYRQTGYVGSSVLFHNGDAKHALQSLPPDKLNDALAITFCTDLPREDHDHGREAVSKIVQLRLHKDKFLQQAHALKTTNIVYATAVVNIDADQLTLWLGDEAEAVPRAVLDCVVTVPVGDSGPGSMRQEGPAQATVGNISCSQDETVFAVEPEAKDFNESQTDVASRVATMLQKLEELDNAGARSVAVEMASLVESDAVLQDHLGRKRILQLCDEIQECCQKLSASEARTKLEGELRDAVMGRSWWSCPQEQQQASGEGSTATDPGLSTSTGSHKAQHLFVGRDKKPLSLFDWKIWTMAKPRLWRYGDAANLFERDEALSTAEWSACILLREDCWSNFND